MTPDHHNQHRKSLFKKHTRAQITKKHENLHSDHLCGFWQFSRWSFQIFWKFLEAFSLALRALKNRKKKLLASLVRICHMVYDFQAGGFSPLINPLAINKSTKQWDSLALGDTPLITRDHRVSHTCRKNAIFFCCLLLKRRRSKSLGHITSGGLNPPPF